MRILTLNCGSSSLKFDVFDIDAASNEPKRIGRGAIDRIGREADLWIETRDRRMQRTREIADHTQAFQAAAELLEEADLLAEIDAVGHRVVHGGGRFHAPTRVDDEILEAVEDASKFAPLHNQPALAAIRSAAETLAGTPMIASFDTTFFDDLPEVATRYALPRDLTEKLGIRRFGFHGLAHRYMIERFRALRPDVEQARLITLQLGNGCSATASLDGAPLDTSMGFTPLEGLVMGTRSGSIDPSLPLFLAQQEGLKPEIVEDLLNRESGLLGLSGRSNDMRELLEAKALGDERAGFAVDAFCYGAKKYIGAYMTVLSGADAVVFGGGIGEHSAEVRQRICDGFDWAGLELSDAANWATENRERRVNADGSRVEAWVIPVDEASVIARDAFDLLNGGKGQ